MTLNESPTRGRVQARGFARGVAKTRGHAHRVTSSRGRAWEGSPKTQVKVVED